MQFGERGQDARARAPSGDDLAAAGARHQLKPADQQSNMGRQLSNGWFSPPSPRTSSFERASATNDTRNSLLAAHQQPFVWKTQKEPEPARFAQGSKKAMKMTRMKKVKHRDALCGVFELRWANVLQTRKAQVGAPKGAWCIGKKKKKCSRRNHLVSPSKPLKSI